MTQPGPARRTPPPKPTGGDMNATRIKFILLVALMALGAVAYLSCGEGSLPPSSPNNTATLSVTGYSQ